MTMFTPRRWWYHRLQHWWKDISLLKLFKHIQNYHIIQKYKDSTTTLEIIKIDNENYIAYEGMVLNNLTINGNLRCGIGEYGMLHCIGKGEITIEGALSAGPIENINGKYQHSKFDVDKFTFKFKRREEE